MLDLRVVRDQPDLIRENLRNRAVVVDLDRLLAVDRARRDTIGRLEAVRQRRNEIGGRMKQPLEAEACGGARTQEDQGPHRFAQGTRPVSLQPVDQGEKGYEA